MEEMESSTRIDDFIKQQFVTKKSVTFSMTTDWLVILSGNAN